MSTVPPFPDADVEALAKVLGGTSTGSEIDRALTQHKIPDRSGQSTKWRRLDAIFREIQAQPLLAFNTLTTQTERSEHAGFATLLKGCFATIRNPRAHEPRILWKDEDDTIDYLTLVSVLIGS